MSQRAAMDVLAYRRPIGRRHFGAADRRRPGMGRRFADVCWRPLRTAPSGGAVSGSSGRRRELGIVRGLGSEAGSVGGKHETYCRRRVAVPAVGSAPGATSGTELMEYIQHIRLVLDPLHTPTRTVSASNRYHRHAQAAEPPRPAPPGKPAACSPTAMREHSRFGQALSPAPHCSGAAAGSCNASAAPRAGTVSVTAVRPDR